MKRVGSWFLGASAVFVTLLVVGVMIFLFGKGSGQVLNVDISASDVTVSVGEKEELIFEVNPINSVITTSTDSENIEIEIEGTTYYIVGITAGDAEVEITARYSGYVCTKTVSVLAYNIYCEDEEYEVKIEIVINDETYTFVYQVFNQYV